MISEYASNIADLLATNLSQRRVTIVPKNDSPLDVLNKHTQIPISTIDPLTAQTQRDIPLFNKMNAAFRESSGDLLEVVDEHNATQDELVKEIANSVRADLTVARTVIIPAVNDLVRYVEEALSKVSFSELANIDLRVWNPAEPLKTGSIERMLENYDDVTYGNPTLGVTVPPQSYEQIREYLKTGSGDLDRDIEKWIATKDVDWLCRRFTQVFGCYQAEENEVPPTFNSLMRSGELDVIDTALMTFLVAHRLFDTPIEGANISLDGWVEKMSALRNQAGKRLSDEVERLNKLLENKIMVLESTRDRRIVVFEPVYKEWIQNGGSNDILFGFTLSNGLDSSVEAINAKAESYTIAWQAQVARYRMSEDTLRFTATRDALKAGFLAQLHAQTEDDRQTNPANGRTMMLAFDKALQDMSRSELDDIYVAALKLLCVSRFANTNGYQFLMLLHRVSKINPDLNDREASALATTVYVTQWLLEQCDVIVNI